MLLVILFKFTPFCNFVEISRKFFIVSLIFGISKTSKIDRAFFKNEINSESSLMFFNFEYSKSNFNEKEKLSTKRL